MVWRVVVVFTLGVVGVCGQDYEGSGEACGLRPCSNNGTCIDETVCLCAEGFTGSYCEIDKTTVKYFFNQRLNTVHIFMPKRVNFKEAVHECLKLGGRIISNISDSDVQNDLRRMWDEFRETDRWFTDAEHDVFWSIAGEYPADYPPPHLAGEDCTASNASGHVQVLPCGTSYLAIMCTTPSEGSCYPEVQQNMCPPPLTFCQYGLGEVAYQCQCRSGFRLNRRGDACLDEDECSAGMRCKKPTVCKNTIGSYYCGCESGKQGNGIDTCGYVLTMEQQNVDLSKIPVAAYLKAKTTTPTTLSTTAIGKEPIDIEYVKQELQVKLSEIYGTATGSIDKIVIKTVDLFSPNNASALYDLYVKDPSISPTSLFEFYKEVERRNRVHWLKGSIPVAASVLCSPSGLGFGEKIFNFSSAQVGESATSTQRCPDGRGKATAACKVKQNGDGTFTAYFDYESVKAVPCELSIASITDEASTINSTFAAEVAMIDLGTLTADYTKSSSIMLKQATDTIKSVADYVRNSNAQISVDTMVSMINVADNINRARKYDRSMGGNLQLDGKQKQEIIQSLEKCSTHVELGPSQTVTIATDFITMQITNSMPMSNLSTSDVPSGILFETQGIGFSDLSGALQCALPTKLQAYINQDILAKAGEIKKNDTTNQTGLPVSFIHYTDSEFFTTQSDKFKVEQVLSARISNLNLTGLQNPIWFQMPHISQPSTSETRYYKCAFLNEDTNEWSSDGCSIVPGSDPPNCTCDHMTNFAILVQTHHRLSNFSLEVFGKVLCSISVIGLFLMLFIHLYFPSLRKSEVVQIHSHLGLCLLLTYIILLTSTERPKPHRNCIASATFLHFFLLSAWGWMLVECFTMYKKLVNVFASSTSYYVTKAATGVYVISGVIALATVLGAVVGYDSANYGGWSTTDSDFVPSSYVSDRFCWLHGYPLIFGFLVPIGIAFVVNLIGSILILRAISWGRRKAQVRSSAKDKPNVRSYLIRAMTVSVILGLSWIFAIPLTATDDPVVNIIFSWLFSIANALQGFFIFILFCVVRDDVRKLWYKELLRYCRPSKRTPSTRLSTSDSARGTREVSRDASTTDDASHNTSTNTGTTKLSQSITSPMETVEEEIEETSSVAPREFFQLGKVSSFHPVGKV